MDVLLASLFPLLAVFCVAQEIELRQLRAHVRQLTEWAAEDAL